MTDTALDHHVHTAPAPHSAPHPTAAAPTPTCQVEIVVPVRNEERDLPVAIARLQAHLRDFPFTARITIADNGSTDRTWELACQLAATSPQVHAVRIERAGRGGALRQVWSASPAQVCVYTDVDLSTDLNALLPLVAPLLSGHSEVAMGTRLARGSRVVRGPKREIISRCYNLLLRGTLAARFSDAQCGFKAIRTDVARQLLPLVADDGWFFDTELLVLAERAGLRIHEVPVDWTDDPDSRVDVVATALADLRGVARVGRALATGTLPLGALRAHLSPGTNGPDERSGLPGQLIRFATIGVASTLAYVLLFLALRQATGPQPANLAALLLTAIGNTAANRRFTFGLRGRRHVGRHQAQGLVVFALGLGLTSGSLAALEALAPGAGRPAEVAVLVTANLAATVLRFVLLRGWVFRQRSTSTPAPATPDSIRSTR